MSSTSYREHKVPTYITWIVVIICLLPFGLNLLGIEFGTPGQSFDLQHALTWDNSQVVDAMHYALAGSFVHTILEWSACCSALLIVLLSFLNYSVKGNPITPTLGLALFFSGVMDAFHTLASDRLINVVPDHQNLIPFTWAICRLFHALIMIGGVLILLMTPAINYPGYKQRGKKRFSLVFVISIVFGAIAYGIIYFSATTYHLPKTIFPSSLITRPWDVIPLILFLLAGWVLYPMFYKIKPSIFADSLVISAIPNVATQVYMAFGSSALFDNNFNIAHFLKIIAYLVPLIGLSLEYVQTYQQEARYLSKNLNSSMNLLQYLANKVLQSTQVTQEIRDSNQQLQSMMTQQAIASENILNTTHKISNTSDRLLLNIQTFDRTLTELTKSIYRLENQVNIIYNDANNITEIVGNITRIAAQTKMLSLNASIEAARTSDNRQEFTVIAREINHLATETSMVAQKIQPIVKNMQSSVKSGVHQMNIFTQEHIEALTPALELLRENIQRQQQGANQISEAVSELNSASEHTANYISETFQQTNVALKDLERAVENLQLEITQFYRSTDD